MRIGSSRALRVGLVGFGLWCVACTPEGGEPQQPLPNSSSGSEQAGAAPSQAPTQTPAAVQADPEAPAQALPAAFKGYELYAWDEGAEFAFTLITGTNRQKSVEEVAARGPEVEADGFVTVRGQGMAALERLLARVPAGTPVLLSELPGLPPLAAAHRARIIAVLPGGG